MHNASGIPGEPCAALPVELDMPACASLCIVDAGGNVLARPPRSIDALRSAHSLSRRVVALRTKGDRRTREEAKELFLGELTLGLGDPATIAVRAAAMDLAADEQAFVAQRRIDLEAARLLRGGDRDPREIGARLAAMARVGTVPTDSSAIIRGHRSRTGRGVRLEVLRVSAVVVRSPPSYTQALTAMRAAVQRDRRWMDRDLPAGVPW